MGNPNHAPAGGPGGGQFTSGPGAGEGANRMTMTQPHQFRVRGNIRVKPAVKAALGSSGDGGGYSGGGGSRARRERVALNRNLDQRGWPGGQAAGEAGTDRDAINRALEKAARASLRNQGRR